MSRIQHTPEPTSAYAFDNATRTVHRWVKDAQHKSPYYLRELWLLTHADAVAISHEQARALTVLAQLPLVTQTTGA